MVTLSDIKNIFRGYIAINEPMSKYTSMRVGGPADYYVEPADKQDLVEIARYFQKNNYPYLMLGRGSNMIISDEGVRCAAINLEASLSNVRMEGDLVVAEAGRISRSSLTFVFSRNSAAFRCWRESRGALAARLL